MKDPNWIVTAFVGAVMGWLLPFAIRAAWFLCQRFQKDHLEGTWHGYHWSYMKDSPTLYRSTWRIRKGVLHKYSVVNTLQDGMKYRGYIVVERGQLIVRTHRRANQETARYRFYWPISSNDDLLEGLWLSFDHDVKIAAGGHILSRKPLADADAIAALAKVTRWERKEPLMRAVT